MNILSLSDCPEFAETCAAWSFGEWSSQVKGRKISDSLQRYQETARSKNNSLPKIWIAVVDDRPAGMISLKENDHEDHQDFTPWLASLYVHSDYRGQNIARKLCQHVIGHAKDSGWDKIYLFTHSAPKLYEKLGFENIGTVRDTSGRNAHGETLMCKNL